jgi:hypothetical protein
MMANNIITMTVAQVKHGNLEFEGLIDGDGEFYVALQQASILFSVPQNNAQRDFKALLGAGFQFVKIRAKRAVRQNRAENALTLNDFEKVLFELTLKKNTQAVEMSRSLIGLSLTQLFSDAFDIKFEKEERQNYLKNRKHGKIVRRCMTDAIKDWCDRNNSPEKVQPYCTNCSDALNVHLFGKKSADLKIEKDVPKSGLLRDYFDSEELRQIYRIEDRVSILSDAMNIKPTDAIKLVIKSDNGAN